MNNFKHYYFIALCTCLCFGYSTFAAEKEKTDLDYIKQFSRETMFYFGLIGDVRASKEKISREFKAEAKKMSELGDEYDLFKSSKESWDYILSSGEPWFEYFSCSDKELLSRWNLKKIIKMQVGPLHASPVPLYLLVDKNDKTLLVENNQDVLVFLQTFYRAKAADIFKEQVKGLAPLSTQNILSEIFFIMLLQNGTLFDDIDRKLTKKFVDFCSQIQIHSSADLSRVSKEVAFDNNFGRFSLKKKHGLWIADYVLVTHNEYCEFRTVKVVLDASGLPYKIEDNVTANLRGWGELSFPNSPAKLWKPITLPKPPSDKIPEK